MPLYELALDFEGASPSREVRLTDQRPAIGDTLQIDWIEWVVVRELDTSTPAEARFECVRASNGQREPREPGAETGTPPPRTIT